MHAEWKGVSPPAQISINDCIDEFLAGDFMEVGDQPCIGCQEAGPSIRKQDLWKLPPVLIIQIKRFEAVQTVTDEEIKNDPVDSDTDISFRSYETEKARKFLLEKNKQDVTYPI